ncbi:S-layer homology domain-containing protein [Paenibacillus turpanensis]|uniref:S-layer homology domain-containing protein n=1 Tax=Paenibacillus turpanensis TaxID=2689078 RepID=UPI00140B1EA2|nr:S-layer homology domain-containing protein [Paenibacillus turpanensis]
MKRHTKWIAALLIFVFAVTGHAYAFQDVEDLQAKQKIIALKEAGIISGIDDQTFLPEGKMTYAQSVHMIVKAMDLSLAAFTFIKAPETTDYFVNVPNDQWYSESFVIAHLHGLPLAKTLDPNTEISREQFAHLLMSAVDATGDYAFVKIYHEVADGEAIEAEHQNSIQHLIIMKAVELDADAKFYPDQIITRADAAVMTHDARVFVLSHRDTTIDYPAEPVNEEVTMQTTAINENVNRVTLAWGEQPSSGYRITIDSIHFNETDKTAEIRYSLHTPDPDKSYLTVITYPKAETYVSSEYQVEVVNSAAITPIPKQ